MKSGKKDRDYSPLGQTQISVDERESRREEIRDENPDMDFIDTRTVSSDSDGSEDQGTLQGDFFAPPI